MHTNNKKLSNADIKSRANGYYEILYVNTFESLPERTSSKKKYNYQKIPQEKKLKHKSFVT